MDLVLTRINIYVHYMRLTLLFGNINDLMLSIVDFDF